MSRTKCSVFISSSRHRAAEDFPKSWERPDRTTAWSQTGQWYGWQKYK